MAGGPVLVARAAGVDVVEPARRVTGRRGARASASPGAGERALAGVERPRGDRLGLVVDEQQPVSVRALDQRRVGARGGGRLPVGQVQVQVQQLGAA